MVTDGPKPILKAKDVSKYFDKAKDTNIDED